MVCCVLDVFLASLDEVLSLHDFAHVLRLPHLHLLLTSVQYFAQLTRLHHHLRSRKYPQDVVERRHRKTRSRYRHFLRWPLHFRLGHLRM